MPKQLIMDNIWGKRLDLANKYYEGWEHLFKCDILNRYYEGEQWKSQRQLGYNPYVINKYYETIQIKIANFIPTFPQFNVASRVGNEDDIATAAKSAQLKEDLLNTIVQDPDNNFSDEIEQAYKDSFFRFGIIEVGYSADWIENPNAPKPLIGKDTDTTLTSTKARTVYTEPPEIPQNERVYFKHIPAKTFRIGGSDHKYLNRCGWCGYYEYVDKDELLALKKLMNRDKLETATASDEDREANKETIALGTQVLGGNQVKIWHIWDLKSMQRLLILDAPKVTLFQKKLDFLNLFDLRPDKRLITNGFYPIPPAFHWLSPQDEYNETREMLRAHRRRFVRKFQIITGGADDEEIEKFETGPDGGLIKVNRENAITPIQNADLGASVEQSIATSADDLNRISGTSDESRGVADRTTATQANIVNQRTGIRDGKERDRVVKWFSHIGRACLLIVREKFTGQTLAKLTQAEGEGFLGSVNPQKPLYRYITAEDIKDGYDFKIDVDVTSMSVIAQEAEKKKLLEYLSILTQFPMVAFSPYLVREIAYRVGYRNEKAIAEFQQMALLSELARMNQLQTAAHPAPPAMPQNGNNGQQIVAQATPPGQEQITNQIKNQLPQATQGPMQ